MKFLIVMLLFIFLIGAEARGEPVRVLIDGINRVSLAEPEGNTVQLSYRSSSLIALEGDTRFFRGIQIELSAPQNFLQHRGSVAAAIYGDLDHVPEPGVADLECRSLAFEPLPARIQTIYQIPLKTGHGLRTSPYATVLTNLTPPSSFPLVFRLMPVIKGISEDLERMVFNLNVKPMLSDEGALRINFRYPENLRDRPLIVLINDEVIDNPREERLLKEGEHHLIVLSEFYRNHSSRFVIERAKVLDLSVELLDPTPLLIFEYPENARVYVNNVLIPNPSLPTPVQPGSHEVRFEVSDYSISRPVIAQRGKTYRIALAVDVNISESD